MKNGIGFGSTEYIVIRANNKLVIPEWIYYFINEDTFREIGKKTMTGTAGQQRINKIFVEDFEIPLPDLKTQVSVIKKLEEERKLISKSEEIIKIFSKKIKDRINKLYEKED